MNRLLLKCELWADAHCFASAELIFARFSMKLLLEVLVCLYVWLWRSIGFVAPCDKSATELSNLLNFLRICQLREFASPTELNRRQVQKLRRARHN
jgi:hypothetical protein